ncbi:MAG: glycosyltransferase family 4 protein [Sphingomonadaceae bacterium]|nr:glycosyltransferase family 4 protein [Sphingomonadaceae bacterium]
MALTKLGHSSIDMAQPPAFRIAVLNTHPIQYFTPLYRYLNAAEDVEVSALFLSDFNMTGGHDPEFGQKVSWDIDLLGGFDHQFLPGRGAHKYPLGFWTYVCPALWRVLSADKYDALWLHGHGFAANILALGIARLRGIAVFMRGETHGEAHATGLKRRLRAWLMPLLYRQCAQMLAIGSRNADHYRALGIAEDKISLVPYSVDNERFAREAAAADRAGVRARHGIAKDAMVILYASKLTRRKRICDLVEAVANLHDRGLKPILLIVGSGEERERAEALAAARGIADACHFVGFVNQGGLAEYYAASDIFVLPSENENWGLIVNEVMAAGLPVVLSREIGCVADLLREGENGAAFEAGDVAGLTDALAPMVADPARTRNMGDVSRAIIAQWGYAQCLAGVRQAIARVRRP